MNATPDTEKVSWLNRQHPTKKLILCLILAVIIPFFLVHDDADSYLILGWDIFCLLLLTFYWITFFTTTHSHIRRQSVKVDPSRIIIFVIILIGSAVSMFAVILLLTSKSENSSANLLHIPLALVAMIFSWLTVQTIFTVRYAHLYYANKKNDTSSYAGGLIFPEEKQPDFLDFAYFSFVLGMTFQVSDVQITSKKIRRLALLHGLIAFAYNTVIVALTINIIAGLKR